MRLWQAILALVALWAALYLPGLGGPELKGEEGRRILPALGMLESGDWTLPVMEGQPYVRKPPLINWAIALSVAATGRADEWSARLPSALSVLVLALTAAVLLRGWVAGPGARSGDEARGALLVGIVLLAHPGLMAKGRLAEIEALYVAISGIAVAAWVFLWRRESSLWLTFTVPWIVLGVGLLCKGPPHLVFFYGLVVATLWKDRSLRELMHPAHGVGVVLMVAVFGAWALAVRARMPVDDSAPPPGETWFQQIAERFDLAQFSAVDWALTPLNVVVMFLPWVVALGVGWRRMPALAARLGGRDGSLVLGFRWGLVVTAVLVLLVPTVRARFLQPLTLPCLALAALVIQHELTARAHHRWTRLAVGFMTLLSFGAVAAPAVVPALRPPGPAVWMPILGAAVAGLAVWRLWLRFHSISQPLRLALATALVAVLASALYAIVIVPARRPLDDMRPIGRRLSAAVGSDQLIILNGGRTPTPLHWRFYLRCPHRVVGRLSDVPAGTNFLLVPTRVADARDGTRRLGDQFGLRHELWRFTDNLGNSFVLISRSEPDAAATPEPPRISLPSAPPVPPAPSADNAPSDR